MQRGKHHLGSTRAERLGRVFGDGDELIEAFLGFEAWRRMDVSTAGQAVRRYNVQCESAGRCGVWLEVREKVA